MNKISFRAIALTLMVSIILSFAFSAVAEGSAPLVFENDIAPRGYNTLNAFSVRRGMQYGLKSAGTVGASVSLDRHNALIAAGWEFKGVEVITITEEDIGVDSFDIFQASSNVIIEGSKAVTSYYEQPRKTKTSYNSSLLDGITNFSTAVTTAISTALPKAKWVPRTFGFITKAIVDASANQKSTFEMVSTLRFYDIQCKIEGWPYYFTCASSERYEAAATSAFNGYGTNGTPFANAGSGFGATQSTHYADKTWLTTKAKEYALKNDGTYYTEDAPTLNTVSLTK